MAIQGQGLEIISVKDLEPPHPTSTTAAIVISMCFILRSSGGVSWFRKKPDELNSLPVFFRFDLFYDLFAKGILSINNPNYCGTGSKRDKYNCSLSSRWVHTFLRSQNVAHATKKSAYK